jgi:hypothetical protein
VLAILLAEKRKQFLREHWNGSILKIGLGNSWFAQDYNWSHLASNQYSVYAAWGVRAGKWGQGILLAQYARTFSDDIKEQYKTSWVYGARVIAGNYWIQGSLELAFHTHTYGRLFGKLRNDINTIRTAAGVEARLADRLWAHISFGVNGPYSDFARNDGVVLAGGLKYAFR